MVLKFDLNTQSRDYLRWLLGLSIFSGVFTFLYWFIICPLFFSYFHDDHHDWPSWISLIIAFIIWALVMFSTLFLWCHLRTRRVRSTKNNTEQQLVKSKSFIKSPELLSSSVRRKLGIDDTNAFGQALQAAKSAKKVASKQTQVSESDADFHSVDLSGKENMYDKITVEIEVPNDEEPQEERKSGSLFAFSRLSSRRKKQPSNELTTTEITVLPNFSDEEGHKVIDMVRRGSNQEEKLRRKSSFNEYLHLVQIEAPDTPPESPPPPPVPSPQPAISPSSASRAASPSGGPRETPPPPPHRQEHSPSPQPALSPFPASRAPSPSELREIPPLPSHRQEHSPSPQPVPAPSPPPSQTSKAASPLLPSLDSPAQLPPESQVHTQAVPAPSPALSQTSKALLPSLPSLDSPPPLPPDRPESTSELPPATPPRKNNRPPERPPPPKKKHVTKQETKTEEHKELTPPLPPKGIKKHSPTPEYLEIIDEPRGEDTASPKSPREAFFDGMIQAAKDADEKRERRTSCFEFPTGTGLPTLKKRISNVEELSWSGKDQGKGHLDDDDGLAGPSAREQRFSSEDIDAELDSSSSEAPPEGPRIDIARVSCISEDFSSAKSNFGEEDDPDEERRRSAISTRESRALYFESCDEDEDTTEGKPGVENAEAVEALVKENEKLVKPKSGKNESKMFLGDIGRQDSVRSEVLIPLDSRGRVLSPPVQLGQFQVLRDNT